MFLPLRLGNFLYGVLFRTLIGYFFGSFGSGAVVLRPRALEGISRIHIGARTYISDAALLAAVPHTGHTNCELRIGEDCNLGRNNHIYATRSVILEEDVLTAGNVYIADNTHAYDNPDSPIKNQPVKQLADVRIGKGSWLGQNVCIIGACVGKGCVIGANSVVLDDIPDYSVAVGSPARVVRKLDSSSRRWVSERTRNTAKL
jgi:acetyltransferase-like isoleucine patch superfamily enzyme